MGSDSIEHRRPGYSGPVNLGRIGILSTWKTACGIADFTANFASTIEKLGQEVEVVPIDRDANKYLSRAELTTEFQELAERLSTYDVVHIQHEFGFFTGAYGLVESVDNFHRMLRYLRGTRCRVVVTFHSAPPFRGARTGVGSVAREAILRGAWRTRVAGDIRKGSVQVVAPTRFLRRLLIDSGIGASSIDVIPQGSPAPASSTNGSEAKVSLGYEISSRLLVVLGFVSEYKGHRVALDAMRQLPEQYHLAVVGGPHPQVNEHSYDRILERSARLKLASRVRLTDYVPRAEFDLYLAAADIVLAPYTYLELANSAAISSALASGRPVIASRIPAFEELNQGLPRVLLATPNAPSELARRIVQLDQDELLKQELVANALAYVRDTSWDLVAERYLSLYAAGAS